MKWTFRFSSLCRAFGLMLIFQSSGYAASATCPSGSPVATFKLTITPGSGGPALPINAVNIVDAGDKLSFEPVKVPKELQKSARVSVLLIRKAQESQQSFEVLSAQALKAPAEWPIGKRVSAIGVVVGPHGIDTKKVAALVEKHPEIVAKVSDYAAQNSRVEALVQALSQYEHSAPGDKSLQSVFQGFSAQYGVKLPALDNKSDSSQQALKMLEAVAPAAPTENQVPSGRALLSKTGGLAESVAAGYFGAPMVAAIGGATLVDNLYSALFPATNIQSAFAVPADSDGMMFCSGKTPDAKTRGRVDYLWITALPNEEAPQVSLTGDVHLPSGVASGVTVSAATVAQLASLSRARDWQLVSTEAGTGIPVKITTGTSSDTLTLDLGRVKLKPGQYHLAAKWDWTPFEIKGTVYVHRLGDIAKVTVAPDSEDALVSGGGPVEVLLAGTDFEFLDSVSLLATGNAKKSYDLPLILPKGKREGEQITMRTEIDTSSIPAGPYLLALKQQSGTTGDVPIVIHPPNPELTETPLRANVGEPQQLLVLHGKHLERIDKIVSAGAEWTLATVPKGGVDVRTRTATIKLDHNVHTGDHLDAEVAVAGFEKPLKFDDVVSVVGERPKIIKAVKSFATRSGIQIRDGEIPAGGVANFALDVDHIDAHPVIVLACRRGDRTRRKLTLAPGERTDSAQFDTTGQDSLFLSLDPGTIGDNGCELVAEITEAETGTSDTFLLGRVIRLPHIDKFDITGEKLSENTYAGTLTGEDLQLVERTGWNAADGVPVEGIPTPVPGSQPEQSLNIVVPWPPPMPKAPLYVWLRGETQARQTTARY